MRIYLYRSASRSRVDLDEPGLMREPSTVQERCDLLVFVVGKQTIGAHLTDVSISIVSVCADEHLYCSGIPPTSCIHALDRIELSRFYRGEFLDECRTMEQVSYMHIYVQYVHTCAYTYIYMYI